MYLNSRLQPGATGLLGNQKGEEVKKVLEIMGRSKRRNPILVGDSEPEFVVKQAATVSEVGRVTVVEMTKLLARFGRGDGDQESRIKLWLIGTATCETFLRCQVYHSTMETDWDLQAVPIASRSLAPGMFPRLGAERLLSNPVESLSSLKTFSSRMPAVTKPAAEQRSTYANLDMNVVLITCLCCIVCMVHVLLLV